MISHPSIHLAAARTSSSGMSLLEVMIAMSVLAVGLLASISGFATLDKSRRMAKDSVVATALVNAIADRFQGVRYDVIGSATNAPWSLERTEPGTSVAAPLNQPLVDDSNSLHFSTNGGTPATRGLQTLGVYPTSTGLENLCIYVEYYRGTMSLKDDGAPDPAKPGLMSGENGGAAYATTTAFNDLFRFTLRRENIVSGLSAAAASTVFANRDLYRVDPTSASSTDTIVMRILVTWGAGQQLSILTARGQ